MVTYRTSGAAAACPGVHGCGAVNRARRVHDFLFFILRAFSVTLPSRRPRSTFAGFYQPSRIFAAFRQPWRRLFFRLVVALIYNNPLFVDMYHCINKTSVSRKNKGKRAINDIFTRFFLYFIRYIVVAIYRKYRIIDSRIDKRASNSHAGGCGCGGARVLYI